MLLSVCLGFALFGNKFLIIKKKKVLICERGVWLVNSWINDFHFRWCVLWLTNCGARRRCLIYPRLRMDCIFFRFRDPDARDLVMESGPWHLAGSPFIFHAWQPGMDMLNIELTSIPIWVKFYNILLEYWTNMSLGHIASVVGNPLHLDSLIDNQSKLSFARICIEVGVDCEFPKSVLLDMGNDKYYTIRINTHGLHS